MKKFLLLLFTACSAHLFGQPIITANPQGTTVCSDSCADLSVSALGTGLTYHWQQNDGSGFLAVGANSNSLEYCPTVAPDSVRIRCIITDAFNDSSTSAEAIVVVDSCIAPRASFTYSVTDSQACFTNTSKWATSYLWNFGDGSSSSAINPCNQFPSQWIYYVKLYAFNAYGSDTLEMEVSLLGTEGLVNETLIFPNPTAGPLHFDGFPSNAEGRLQNSQGQTVFSETIDHQWQLSHLPSGLYFLTIQTSSEAFTQRLVLQ